MRSLLRPAAAAFLAVAAVLIPVSVSAPAHADDNACSGPTGVTVVVDFNGLGGGVQGTCVEDGGGKTAQALFAAAEFTLNTQTPGNPGYVCQVNVKPGACTPPDGDNYWSLWKSEGSGSWSYATLGVGSLRVADGGYVAFSWDDVRGDDLPSYTPTARTSQPSPSPSQPSAPQPTQPAQPSAPPSPGGAGTSGSNGSGGSSSNNSSGGGSQSTSPGTGGGGSSTAAPSAGPTSSSTPSSTPTAPGAPSSGPTTPGVATPTPTTPATPSASASDDVVTELADPEAVDTEATSADADGGLPWWAPVLVIALLVVTLGGAVLARRRRAQG